MAGNDGPGQRPRPQRGRDGAEGDPSARRRHRGITVASRRRKEDGRREGVGEEEEREVWRGRRRRVNGNKIEERRDEIVRKRDGVHVDGEKDG